jgi:hypothetical protein
LGTWSCEKAQGDQEAQGPLAKVLDSKPQGDGDCATQQRIDEGLLGKKKTPRSLVDEELAAWIYNTTQSFDVAGHDLRELVNYILKYAPKDYVSPAAKRIRGELLDAMGMEDCAQPMEVVVSASVYCLKSSGNAGLLRKYTEHLDPEFQQLMLFPVQAAQHWYLLTYQPGIAQLCACGSGVGKVFAHSA